MPGAICTFQEVVTQEQPTDNALLLLQDISWAGFYHTGTIASLATKAIRVELEKARAARLGERIDASLPRTAYERWAWEACSNIRGQFLQSPPDHFGYMKDPTFQVAIATYFGQPCHLMPPRHKQILWKERASAWQVRRQLSGSYTPRRRTQSPPQPTPITREGHDESGRNIPWTESGQLHHW